MSGDGHLTVLTRAGKGKVAESGQMVYMVVRKIFSVYQFGPDTSSLTPCNNIRSNLLFKLQKHCNAYKHDKNFISNEDII